MRKTATKVLNGTDKNNHLTQEYFSDKYKVGTDRQTSTNIKRIAIWGLKTKNVRLNSCYSCLFVAFNYNALETYLFVRNKAMVLV